MSDDNNSDSEEECWRRLKEEGDDIVVNKILHQEDSYWCICGGRFNVECIGDAFWCLFSCENDMFGDVVCAPVCNDDFKWSNLSEEIRDEWKIKNLTQSAWDEIEEVDSVLSSPTVWNSMSSRERYDWKNKCIKQRDDWISRSLKRLTGDSYEP